MGAGESVYVARTLVTNAQYAGFLAATGYAAPQNWTDGTYPAGEDDFPVNYVSAADAEAYCAWLTERDGANTYRLPNESEWELAAGHMPKDADFNCGVNDGRTSVEEYAKVTRGAHGAVDFWGNVWEWTTTVRSDSTLGVKVSWTLGNEENWNRTHRFAGKLWVGGGLLLLLGALLPLRAMVWVMICVTAALGIAPIAYSYAIFRQHRKAGVAYEKIPKSRAEKIASRVAAVLVCVTLLGTALLLFTGSMEASCSDTALTIHATWWADLSLSYSEIDTIEYRSSLDTGMRTNGFGSARVSLGTFCNDEFGSYTLYAYTKASEFVVLTADGKALVIGMDEPERTREIYDELIARIHR